MMKHIKPAKPGLILRNHQDKFRVMPDEGAMVQWDATWAKRVSDGDAVVVEPKPEKAPRRRLASVVNPTPDAEEI